MPYGVKSAPKLFQCIMDKILVGLRYVLCFQDDVLIVDNDIQNHVKTLATVFERLLPFERLLAHNVRLNKSKCSFLAKEVTYLGYKVNAEGLRPVEDKVRDIVNLPAPKNVSELKAFLGMIQYYSMFLSGLSSVLAPLHELLKKGIPWK